MERLQAASALKISTFGIFFITDRVSQCKVSLVRCPTGDTIGDFMTKPLQGDMFLKFRDQIMIVIPSQDPGPGNALPGKSQPGKAKPGKGKAKKGKKNIFLSLVPPVGQHHRSVLGEFKNGLWSYARTCDHLGEHVHVTVIRWANGCIGN